MKIRIAQPVGMPLLQTPTGKTGGGDEGLDDQITPGIAGQAHFLRHHQRRRATAEGQHRDFHSNGTGLEVAARGQFARGKVVGLRIKPYPVGMRRHTLTGNLEVKTERVGCLRANLHWRGNVAIKIDSHVMKRVSLNAKPDHSIRQIHRLLIMLHHVFVLFHQYLLWVDRTLSIYLHDFP
jgi:hypothetical protein